MKRVNTHEIRLVICPDGKAYSMRPQHVESFIKNDMKLFARKREDYIVKVQSGIVFQ